MDLKFIFYLIATFLWPLLMAYAAYLQQRISVMQTKLEQMQQSHYNHVAQVNKDFATRAAVTDLENKLTTVLNRIDDKVTRILEDRK
jgi:hypothetical protein